MSNRGQLAVDFIEQLRCGSGGYLGQPLILRPWQQDIVRRLFGTLRPDGRRQYRRCYIWIPRKNGKTEIAAALALYTLIADGEPGAQVYSAAADRDNASLIFRAAANMIQADEELSALCEVIESTKTIRYPATGSVYKALSSEAYSKHGLNAHCVIYDELHAAPNRELWDVLTTSQGARRQPLVIVISTAGYDRASIGWQVYDHARKVLDGLRDDPALLPVIYEAAATADWRDEATWYAANPALGDFREIDELRDKFLIAQDIIAEENTFRRLYLNQWTEQIDRWLSVEKWDAQAGPPVTEAECVGRKCVGGLDLASVSDLTSWVLLFERPDGKLDVLHRSFVPESQLTRAKNPNNCDLYAQWAREGYLLVTPGEATDYRYVTERVIADCQRFNVRGVNVDKMYQGQSVYADLEDAGVRVWAMGQQMGAMKPAVLAFEKLFIDGKLRHGGDPVLRWAVRHAVIRRDTDGKGGKVEKAKSQEKVDPLVAAIMAVDRVERQDFGNESVYEDRGIILL